MKYAEQRTVTSWTVQFEKSLEKEKLKLSNWCVSFSTGSGSLAAPIFSKKDRAQINNKQKYDMKKTDHYRKWLKLHYQGHLNDLQSFFGNPFLNSKIKHRYRKPHYTNG